MITVSTESIEEPTFTSTTYTTSTNNIPQISCLTHNVRSFTNVAKQNHLLSLYSSFNIDIIASQETNFKPHHIKSFIPSHPTYISFFSSTPNQRTAFGVGLIIKKNIAHHVFRHETKFDRMIYIDMQFTNKQRLRIINCYLPPAELKV